MTVTDEEKMRRLPWSFAFGATSSAFGALTYFGPVFVLFLSELGIPKTGIGFLLSLLPFTGLIALFIASHVAALGVKRVFLTFYTARKMVTSLLLLTPWVVGRYGAGPTFLFVAVIVMLFALCRAIAETAIYPWFQEIVPDSFRGRYHGINHIITLLASSLALGAASVVVDRVPGLDRFLALIAAGAVLGILSAAFATRIPGGSPRMERDRDHFQSIRKALTDSNLRTYLIGMGLVSVVNHTVLMAFVPLFMKEMVGLKASQIILLQVGSYLAGFLSSYLWGWAADHAGSKPVAISSLYLMFLPPLLWIFMPRGGPLSFLLAMIAAALVGMSSAGWLIGDQRLLYVDVVPPAKRTEYMAVFYAWIGLLGGCGPLIAGYLVDALAGLRIDLGFVSIDPYTPLFVASILLLGCAIWALGRLKTVTGVRPSVLARALLGRLR